MRSLVLTFICLLLAACGGPAPVEMDPTAALGQVDEFAPIPLPQAPLELAEGPLKFKGIKELQAGIASSRAGSQEEAEMHFKRALEIEPRLAEANYNLGLLAEWNGNLLDARNYYEKAIDSRPAMGEAVKAMVTVLFRLESAKAAQSFAKKALKADPQNLSLQNAYYFALLLTPGHAEEVIAASRKILQHDEKNVAAMLNMADAFEEQKKHELAIAILNNTLVLDPENAEILSKMAKSQLALGFDVNARATLEKAVNCEQGAPPEAANTLGLIYLKVGDFLSAEAMLRLALHRWPHMTEAEVNLASALKGQKRYAEAVSLLNESLKTAQGTPLEREIHYSLGVLYLDAQLPDIDDISRLELAQNAFNRYLKFEPNAEPEIRPYLKDAAKRLDAAQKRKMLERTAVKSAESESSNESSDSLDFDESNSEEVQVLESKSLKFVESIAPEDSEGSHSLSGTDLLDDSLELVVPIQPDEEDIR